jgi:hypothetical protein
VNTEKKRHLYLADENKKNVALKQWEDKTHAVQSHLKIKCMLPEWIPILPVAISPPHL